MPIDKRKSKQEIIKELIDKYEKTGKIGTSSPKTKKEAIKQATAIAYSSKKEDCSRLSRIKNLVEVAVFSPQASLMLDQYGSTTPNFMLKKIQGDLEKRGYASKVLKEDENYYLLQISRDYDIIKKVKIDKHDLLSGNIDINDLL